MNPVTPREADGWVGQRRLPLLCLTAALIAVSTGWSRVDARDSVVFEGRSGPGAGRHVVFVTGDEEYRSEEGLTQMARILAKRHGFRCTVLFALDDNGVIDPTASGSLAGAEALDQADAIFMMIRFREYPDATMKHFVDAYLAGKPIVALRTSTHAFRYSDESTSPYRHYSFRSTEWEGGFGRQVLGETWVGHHGKNHHEATHGIIEPSAKEDPILRGVGPILADTGAYKANPPPDCTILMRGEVLAGPAAAGLDSPPEATGKNDPMQPIAWHRIHHNEAGRTNRVFCTTLGSSTDIRDENFRRLLVNGVYWGLGLEVPEKADVRLVGPYEPTAYGMKKFRKGIRPRDLAARTRSR